MTMDRTLKTHGRLGGTRSVLSRAERIAKLVDEGKFDPEASSPLGLPKTRVRHSKAGTKSKKAAAPAEGVPAAEAAEGAAAPAEGEAAKTDAKATKVDAKAAKGQDKKK